MVCRLFPFFSFCPTEPSSCVILPTEVHEILGSSITQDIITLLDQAELQRNAVLWQRSVTSITALSLTAATINKYII